MKRKITVNVSEEMANQINNRIEELALLNRSEFIRNVIAQELEVKSK